MFCRARDVFIIETHKFITFEYIFGMKEKISLQGDESNVRYVDEKAQEVWME